MSKVFSFRFSDDVAEKLIHNATTMKLTTASYLALKIEADYDQMHGNKKVKEAVALIEELGELSKKMEIVFKS